jgi:hypothetical protein
VRFPQYQKHPAVGAMGNVTNPGMKNRTQIAYKPPPSSEKIQAVTGLSPEIIEGL